MAADSPRGDGVGSRTGETPATPMGAGAAPGDSAITSKTSGEPANVTPRTVTQPRRPHGPVERGAQEDRDLRMARIRDRRVHDRQRPRHEAARSGLVRVELLRAEDVAD